MSRWNIKIYGIVQGVGFRPFVSRLAVSCHICGTVCNKGPYVEIDAEGTKADFEQFRQGLRSKAPERSSILKMDIQQLESNEKEPVFEQFSIIESAREQGDIFVSPDIATCDKCREELFDPKNRRYLHPFINCTACGPRLTILDAMPYDRERTSMKEFPMCPECQEEYTTPNDRRYDAQPVCCNHCGPEVYLLGKETIRRDEAIKTVRRVLAQGGIAAVKGIGGFHLCCDATNEKAVARLRRLKHRPVKPFAVMMRNIESVHRSCRLEPGQEEVLTGHQKPILLLRKNQDAPLAPSIAPGNPKIGVMLPYTPIHMLLFDYPDGLSLPDALVMTSGNPAGAPICHNDQEAQEALAPLCDVILSHNRRIRLRADDTVMDWFEGKPYMIRRSRGFAPLPFIISPKMEGQVLGIGGELKNTFCLSRNGLFYPSPYIGDMSDLRTISALKDSVRLMESLLETRPVLVGCDLHPRYNTTAAARELGMPLFPVQHHYAHILSCMAENDIHTPVIGVSFDGTGYGGDGTIWGGEILAASCHTFRRLGSIEPFRQAGGDRSSREGWRIALALLYDLRGKEEAEKIAEKLQLCNPHEFSAMNFLLHHQINTVISTSAGRLFDAVSALLGIRRRSTFEGESAMSLQFAAEEWLDNHAEAPLKLQNPVMQQQKDRFLLPTGQLFSTLTTKRLAGEDSRALAYLFHIGIAQMIDSACREAREKTGLSTVALSGGVFQNLLLLKEAKQRLDRAGFRVLLHSQIPPNDGGLCLGQAMAALYHLSAAPS